MRLIMFHRNYIYLYLDHIKISTVYYELYMLLCVLNVWNLLVLWNIFLFVFPCCMFQSVFVLMCLVSVSVCQCVCQALSLAVSVSRWYLSPLWSSSCLVRSRSKSVLSLEFPLVAPSDNLLENSSHVFNNQGCHGDPIIRWGSHQWTWTVRWGSLHASLCSLQSTKNYIY